MTADLGERPAEPGEFCTCGRPARLVFLLTERPPVGWCGVSNVAPVLPCPFCGSEDPAHRNAGLATSMCPAYRLRPND